MPLDPQIRALLDMLRDEGAALPMHKGSAEQARRYHKALIEARKGPHYIPEAVAAMTDRTISGAYGKIPIRVYTPRQRRGRVVTYFHGGGFVLGDIDTHDPIARMIANFLGATVVSVDYRKAPEHPYPAALDDAITAATWTADTFPADTLIVAGDSAGATLAAGVALDARDSGSPEIAALLLAYPSTDPTLSMPSVAEHGDGYYLTSADIAWFIDQYLPNPEHRIEPSVDLLNADLADLPPTVVTTAEFDPLRDEGDALVSRMRADGVIVEHIPAPGLIHGYGRN